MRLLVSALLVAACFAACAHAFPAMDTSEESDERKNVDTVLVLSGSDPDLFGKPRVPQFDVDDSNESWSPFRPSYPSMYFEYLRQSLQDLMNRLRDQLSTMSSHLPSAPNFPSFVGPWKTPELANSTSTTKVIDGHVVTINDTIYSDGNDTESMYIRVRVIDIKPQNETTMQPDGGDSDRIPITTTIASISSEADEDKEVTTPSRSVETVEEMDNEIPTFRGDTLNA